MYDLELEAHQELLLLAWEEAVATDPVELEYLIELVQ
jgi:hypothetical protein